MVTTCARSLERPTNLPEDEVFCGREADREVIVSFNGVRYLVAVCAQHGKEHDDVAARRRLARQEANREAQRRHEARERVPR
jgi:hypothetical protein